MLRRPLALLAVVAVLVAGCTSEGRQGSGGRSARAPAAQPGDDGIIYVARDTYPGLLVEIDYIEGFAPSGEAIAEMQRIFSQRLDKPAGVRVELSDAIVDPGPRRYQVGDLLALESQFRQNHSGDAANRTNAVMWVIYLNGESEFDTQGTRALGIAYDASSVAVFRENIRRTSARETESIVEAMTLVHEGGHLFGLVNNGLPMATNHEDGANPRHDADPDCVMHHRIDTGNVARLLTEPPIDFDYWCRLDMHAAGGLDPGDRGGAEPPTATAAPILAQTARGPIPLTAPERFPSAAD